MKEEEEEEKAEGRKKGTTGKKRGTKDVSLLSWLVKRREEKQN